MDDLSLSVSLAFKAALALVNLNSPTHLNFLSKKKNKKYRMSEEHDQENFPFIKHKAFACV